MKRIITLISILGLLAAPAAYAGDEYGCIGINELGELAIIGGPASLEGKGVDSESSEIPFDRSGGLFVGRMHICMIEKQSRFGSFMGWDANLGLGYYTLSWTEDTAEGEVEKTDDDFYIDFSLGMNGSILSWGDENEPTGRLAFLLGLGLDIDFAYVYGGIRLGTAIVEDTLGLEVSYVITPVGFSWSGAWVLEHRPSLTVLIDFSKTLRVGIGAEARIGSHEDEDGFAPLDQDFIGEYYIVSGILSFRFRS